MNETRRRRRRSRGQLFIRHIQLHRVQRSDTGPIPGQPWAAATPRPATNSSPKPALWSKALTGEFEPICTCFLVVGETGAPRGEPTANMQTPHREGSESDRGGPSCFEATALTAEPPCCHTKNQTHKQHTQIFGIVNVCEANNKSN